MILIDESRIHYILSLYSEKSHPMIHELGAEVRRLRECSRGPKVCDTMIEEKDARIRELEGALKRALSFAKELKATHYRETTNSRADEWIAEVSAALEKKP